VEDNQWILDLAAKNPFIVGFVGNLPVGTPEFATHLTRFAANPIFRGLRVSGGRIGEGARDPKFIADLHRLAERDLELDLNGPPGSLADVDRIAREVPKLRIVINHVSNLKIDGKSPDPDWVKGMQRAAEHPNVNAKVSGLVEGTGKTDGTAARDVEFYRPVLDTIWSAFGEDRLIYGSNWPVSARFANLMTVQGIVSDYFSAKGPVATEKVFSGNSQTAYKWVKRA
jgi:predicted TIM-barrel fold metal-dependent hydrolase